MNWDPTGRLRLQDLLAEILSELRAASSQNAERHGRGDVDAAMSNDDIAQLETRRDAILLALASSANRGG